MTAHRKSSGRRPNRVNFRSPKAVEKIGGVPWYGDIELNTKTVFEAFWPTIGYERFDPARCDLQLDLAPAFVRSTPYGKDAVVVCWSHKRPDAGLIAAARGRVQEFGFRDLLVVTETLFRTQSILQNAELIRFGGRGQIDADQLALVEAAAQKLGEAATIAAIGDDTGLGLEAMQLVLRLLRDRKLVLRDPCRAIDANSSVAAPDLSKPDLGDPLAAALTAIETSTQPRWSEIGNKYRCFESFSEKEQKKADLKLEYVRAMEELFDRFDELKPNLYVRSPAPAPKHRYPEKGIVLKVRGYARPALVYTRWRRIDAARRSPEAKKRSLLEEAARSAGIPFVRERLPAHVFPALKAPSGQTLKEWGRALKNGGRVALIDRNDLKGNRTVRVSWQVDEIIKNRIDKSNLKNINNVRDMVEADLQAIRDTQAIKIDMPSRDALEHRIKSTLTAKKRMTKRHGPKTADATFGGKKRFPQPTRPFQVGEIDIAQLNTMCARYDAEGRIIETFRPWLLAIIDKATNVILDIWICETVPTAAMVGRFLRRAMRRGVFQYLVIDGGSQFKAIRLVAALEIELDCVVKLCRAGAAELKGKIEAWFNKQQMALELPGDTGRNPQDRGERDSQAEACISIERMNEITQIYARDVHGNEAPRGPGRKTPNALMSELQHKILTPRVSEYAMAALLLREETYTIRPEGIVYDSIAYDSPEIRRLHGLYGEGKTVTVKPDDDDVSYLVVICPETRTRLFVEATDKAIPVGLTREALREERDRAKATNGVAEGRPQKSRALLKIEEIVEGEKKRGRHARNLGPVPQSPSKTANEANVSLVVAASSPTDTFYSDLAKEFAANNDGDAGPEPLAAWARSGVKRND